MLDSAIELPASDLWRCIEAEAKQYVLPALGRAFDRLDPARRPTGVLCRPRATDRSAYRPSKSFIVSFSRVMKVAVQDGLIAGNPAAGVHAPRPERQPGAGVEPLRGHTHCVCHRAEVTLPGPAREDCIGCIGLGSSCSPGPLGIRGGTPTLGRYDTGDGVMVAPRVLRRAQIRRGGGPACPSCEAR